MPRTPGPGAGPGPAAVPGPGRPPVAFVAGIAQGIFVVLFILFVARRLHGDSSKIGLLRGVQAVGAIAGGLGLAMLARNASPGRLVAGAALIFGAVDLTIWNAPALTTATVVYVALFIAAGAPGVVMETGLVSLLQVAAPVGARGRTFGALGMVTNAGQAVGMLGAGALASQLGLMTLLNAQGLLYLVGRSPGGGRSRRPARRARAPAATIWEPGPTVDLELTRRLAVAHRYCHRLAVRSGAARSSQRRRRPYTSRRGRGSGDRRSAAAPASSRGSSLATRARSSSRSARPRLLERPRPSRTRTTRRRRSAGVSFARCSRASIATSAIDSSFRTGTRRTPGTWPAARASDLVTNRAGT